MTPFVETLLSIVPNLKWAASVLEVSPFEKFVAYKVRKEYLQFCIMLPTPAHEVAHMVEMNDITRTIKDDWGMPIFMPKDPKRFFAALAREARVRGIQSHMDANKGFTNQAWFNEAAKHLPFGRFTSEGQVFDWAHTLWLNASRAWNQDRIQTVWTERIEYIRHWQETRDVPQRVA